MSKFLKGLRGGLAVTYGASADAGETDDPLVDATAYSTSVIYAEGAIVSSAGAYYYSRVSGNFNQLLTNNTYWLAISNFVYVDATSGSDANTYNSNPVTAAANPVQTLNRVQDLVIAAGSPNVVNAPAKTLILLKRGDTYTGALTIKIECIIGAWGSRVSGRPIIQFGFTSNTGLSFTGNTVEIQTGGDGTIVRNIKITPRFTTHYGFVAGTGTMADGDRIWKQSDHTMQGTVRGALNSNRITIQWDTNTDSTTNVNSVVFETQDTLKNFTMAASTNRTAMSGYSAQATNCRVLNCEVYNSCGNGMGSGITNSRGSADNFYCYNVITHHHCKGGLNGAGFQGGWGANIKILHCTSYDNGTAGSIFNHNFYLDDLDNCEFAYNWCYMTVQCGNSSLVVHGECHVGWIHDNLMELSQAGLGINDGYTDIAHTGWYEVMDQFTVERNIIRNCGFFGPDTDSGPALDFAALTNSVIKNNIVYGCKGYCSLATNKHTADKAFTDNVTIAYNTLISGTYIGAGDYWLKISAFNGVAPTNIVVENNIIESQRTNVQTFSIDSGTPVANVSFNNNLIYNTTGYSTIIHWRDAGGTSTSYTLANWAATGSINSNTTNVTTTNYASVFTNEAAGDLTLPGGSPAKGIGTPIPAITTRDFSNYNRSVTAPSAGARE